MVLCPGSSTKPDMSLMVATNKPLSGDGSFVSRCSCLYENINLIKIRNDTELYRSLGSLNYIVPMDDPDAGSEYCLTKRRKTESFPKGPYDPMQALDAFD